MRLLIVNAGSSTLKLSVLDDDALVASELIETVEGPGEGSLSAVVGKHGPFDAVGHRIVHGGTDFTRPVLVDDDVVRRLEALSSLAPLHQPKSLAGLAVLGRLLPGVPAVACFDTGFHATIPAAAATYALPATWRQRWELRRYGFHGLSHSYASRRSGELMGQVPAQGAGTRVVTCHLGAGASLAAVRGGVCVDTTMGFTPLEGLVMATRSGTVDPGLVLWLAEQGGLKVPEIAEHLEHHSGLLGLAGTADMRAVLSGALGGNPDAALALGVYLHRLCGCLGSMVASLGGLDALVFTGGIGEHAAQVRLAVAAAFRFLGVAVDQSSNDEARPDCEVTASGAAVRTFVIVAREDLEIARGVREVVSGERGSAATEGAPTS